MHDFWQNHSQICKMILIIKVARTKNLERKVHPYGLLYSWYTLESGIDVGQGINVGSGKFAKKTNVGHQNFN